jgi:uncharacterized protein (TIGR02611 family)
VALCPVNQTAGQRRERATLVRRFLIALMGGTVVLIGIALLILPGPGVVIMAAGLAILATEFLWARRTMLRCRSAVDQARRHPWLRWTMRRQSQQPLATPRKSSPIIKPERG